MILHRVTANRAFPTLTSLGAAVLGMTVAAVACTFEAPLPSRKIDNAASARERSSWDSSADTQRLVPISPHPVSFREH